MESLVSALILLGIVQGAVLAPVLWARTANRLANRILATLVAAVTLMMILGDLARRWGFSGHPHLLGLNGPIPFLFGPLLYLYVIALTRPLERFDPRWLVHALPFVGDVLFMTDAFYMKDANEKLALAQAANAGIAPASYHLVAFFQVLQAFAYLFLAWRALERYGTKMRGFYSDLARIDLRWLRVLVLANAAVWTVVLAATALRALGQSPGPLGAGVQIGSSLAIFVTGYASVFQSELAPKARAAKVADPEPPPPEPPRTKYQRNRLDDAEAKELVAKLEALMQEKHLYRDAALTLPTLADALAITPHMLSQLLNVRIGKSFFVYVNGYRVDALKRSLADAPDRGVLELAFEVGFSSKSSLNSVFKKLTGTTPTEYRKTIGKSRG